MAAIWEELGYSKDAIEQHYKSNLESWGLGKKAPLFDKRVQEELKRYEKASKRLNKKGYYINLGQWNSLTKKQKEMLINGIGYIDHNTKEYIFKEDK